MLIRGLRRLVLIVCPLLVFVICLHLYKPELVPLPAPVGKWAKTAYGKATDGYGEPAGTDVEGDERDQEDEDWVNVPQPDPKASAQDEKIPKQGAKVPEHEIPKIVTPDPITGAILNGDGDATSAEKVTPEAEKSGLASSTEVLYTELFSVSTKDKKYFPITFGDKGTINPNIIPHPTVPDIYIIVARNFRHGETSNVNEAITCNAAFKDDKLECLLPPTALPIAPTGDLPGSQRCKDKYAILNFNVGPHDSRMFYGPRTPYVLYGSNSLYTCFGQWIQDFRRLVPWEHEPLLGELFETGTEIQRPAPFGPTEKNWFIFWDGNEQAYVHYDVVPSRSFAKLNLDGSVGEDLAHLTADQDKRCMAAFGPKVSAGGLESVHQATNSISITLCKRSDPSCVASDANTFVLAVFQHKSFYSFHSEYEPYVMLISRAAPFATHAISKKPFWISGRSKEHKEHNATGVADEEHAAAAKTEMFYVTSVGWKEVGRKYHGFLDDVLFVNFGIEDERTGGIDVLAEDLVGDLGVCGSVGA